ncbi:diaminopimelate decarboxylase [Halogeometricum borinquense DSM 11551]|uniref:Diaminopimelate decarboxylase n=1 Tax=Halogeometricum borinquense (strain ATCC 700274 / DSM 11551 / JCM 10706 / KCTC 4070 / PR3) TaxID=469382 RepID=E4NQH5_HALBP|nr:diaminopimelate decarboxylase [Halogeometricum borinquense]ADQ67848.1 diaminopimelate decarboxylase [Halogeometricum borinquense DSM 11551]ELY23470.1 diaminopimelate decarboxylase [Halogeometricum borinquense DSM 11551]
MTPADGGSGADASAEAESDAGTEAESEPNTDAENPQIRRLSEWDADRLARLADEYGTPLYVIDTDRVQENCARLQEAFSAEEVRYAVKAHTGRAVLETVREAGLAAECASAGEVERALNAGYEGSEIQYTAVNPPARDLDHVVDRWRDHPELTVTVGAADTADRLRERGFDGRLCIRANPGVGAGHHEKVRTGANAKFGVPYDDVPELAESIADDFDLVGLHAHAGSGISGDDLSNHRELVRRMGELTRNVESRVGSLEFVDVGGGFGVPYRADEPPLDLDSVADATREALGDVSGTLAVEPGRYVVADAGVLLTRVNTVKEAPDATVVGVDAGMTTLLRPAMYDAYHEIRNVSAADDVEAISATVAGPICESADVMCENRLLAYPRRGNLLAVGNAGAYGYEMASTYNSRPRPAEVALSGGAARLVRRRETLTDLTELEA